MKSGSVAATMPSPGAVSEDAAGRAQDETPTPLGKVVVGASVGTLIEYYDFGIYSSLAVQLGVNFFPQSDPQVGVILAVATTGVAFLVRPLGGALFGVLSDTVGRKFTFMITLLLMSLATIAIGLVPSYAVIGMAAPIIILCLRMAQGLAVGGEYAAASTYVVEHAPDQKRGFYTGWLAAMTSASLVLSLLAVAGTSAVLGKPAFNAYGWRIPFLLAAVMLLFALFIRWQLKESPIFIHLKKKMGVARSPLRDIFTDRGAFGKCMAVAFGICAPQITIGLAGSMFALYSLQTVGGVDPGRATLLVAFGCTVSFVVAVLAGWLSDSLGRRNVQIAGMLFGLVAVYPVFGALLEAARAGSGLIWLWIGVLQLPAAIIVGPGFAAMTEAFPASRRATSVALAFSIGGIIGGFGPGISLYLAKQLHDPMAGLYWPLLVMAVGVVVYWLWLPDLSGRRMWDEVMEPAPKA